ncbi:type VI secretion system Vgr family protein [Psychrobacter sp. AOP22-C1-C5]|uniref:type VI secretion system Vgr family protein n=1 Tax=Psychrobacter sp. AOP22-C1-C5 TaxID=3457716 RepID=UPI0040366500
MINTGSLLSTTRPSLFAIENEQAIESGYRNMDNGLTEWVTDHRTEQAYSQLKVDSASVSASLKMGVINSADDSVKRQGINATTNAQINIKSGEALVLSTQPQTHAQSEQHNYQHHTPTLTQTSLGGQHLSERLTQLATGLGRNVKDHQVIKSQLESIAKKQQTKTHQQTPYTLIDSAADTSYVSEDRGDYKIQDLAFFCHGLNGKITLNYSGRPNIDLTNSDINRIGNNNFLSSAIASSYACRTGMSDSLTLRTQGSFNSISEADSSNSFAQLFANKHNIDFYASYKRTLYSNILNPKSDADKMFEEIRNKRATNKDKIISILGNYEALPHADLGESYKNIWGLAPRGAVAEGTNDYSLWRKGDGLGIPIAAKTPTGLPASMTKFTPK